MKDQGGISNTMQSSGLILRRRWGSCSERRQDSRHCDAPEVKKTQNTKVSQLWKQIPRAALLYSDSCRTSGEHPLSGTFEVVGQWKSYEQLGLLIIKLAQWGLPGRLLFFLLGARLQNCFSPDILILTKYNSFDITGRSHSIPEINGIYFM